MNFYDVLAAKNWSGGIPTINFFDLLFAQSMGGGEQWKTYEGTLPATLYANGDDMKHYQVYGATGGVGDRTVNLFDLSTCVLGKYIDDNGIEQTSSSNAEQNRINHSDYIPLGNESSYIFTHNSTITTTGNRTVAICWYDAQKVFISRTAKGINLGTSSYYLSGNLPQNAAFAIVNFVGYTSAIPGENSFTPGTTPPETFVPFGYEVDMGVKSGNLLSFDALMNAPSGSFTSTGATFTHMLDIYGKPNTQYTMLSDGAGSTSGGSDSNRSLYFGGATSSDCVFVDNPITKTSDNEGLIKIGFLSERTNAQQYINGTAHVWLVEGALPLPYQPYYNTTTPIYIGDDPLEEDEYVDYQEQKIYRMSGGVLTPADPPVPLPSLPTCEGTTVVDYAGSGAAPEKVYFEYQGGKQP